MPELAANWLNLRACARGQQHNGDVAVIEFAESFLGF
jgi:hypothetical protein